MLNVSPEDTDDFPTNTLQLIDWLDKAIPARCLGPTEDVIEAHRYAGSREVVETLMAWRDEYLQELREAQSADHA